jgi:hypothetical protein
LAEPVVPSFLLKLARAEKHIADLTAEINAYSERHPYRIERTWEGGRRKRLVRRLHFTESPENTNIPIVLADVIYNVRSGLDHLMAALVPKKHWGSVMFPIYFQDVWTPSSPRDNKQDIKSRERWTSDMAKLSRSEPIEILKRLQPERDSASGQVDLLVMVNTLSNKDRHSKLPVVAGGLKEAHCVWKMPDGTARSGTHESSIRGVVKNGVEIVGDIPDDAHDEVVLGIATVVIEIADKSGVVE